MIEQGYILLARKSLNSGIWNKPPLYWKVWCYILLRAFYQDTGNLEKGQFKTSIKEIQEACSYQVGYRKETPSAKQIRSILDYLRFPNEETNEEAMIVTTKVTNGILIKALKYEHFQCFENYESSTNGQRTDNESLEEGETYKKTNKNNKSNNKKTTNKTILFVPPTLEEIKAYCIERNNNINAEHFINYYTSNGWMVGKNKMKDWKACVRTWETNNKKNNYQNNYQKKGQDLAF